ncbi:lysylphosphatidylglycerol synthase domain-containing protein, partial [Nonomuraea sp. NPDC055795]
MRNVTRAARRIAGAALLAVACWYLTRVVSGPDLAAAARALLSDPLGLALALILYGTAFALRSWSWTRVLPGLPGGQAWAAVHVSLLGNHVLPFRLGEALRATSVLRRTRLTGAKAVVASVVAVRSADLFAVLALALVAAPALVDGLAGWWVWPVGAVLALVTVVAFRFLPQAKVPLVTACALVAWVLEAAVVYEVARMSGVALSPADAVAVTAVTIAAQTVAVTPGGIGSYEAAATAALTALGVAPGPAFAVALLTHAVKTAYALAVGVPALFVPAPGYFGRFRLPRRLPPRPPFEEPAPGAPIVVFIPVYNEEATIGEVVTRLPRTVSGRPVVTLVIDDGSADASADRARAAGATVLHQPRNLGLGAAVRRGLGEASARSPAVAVYLDADLEYFPEDLESLAAPVLSGAADYVVGSRFS